MGSSSGKLTVLAVVALIASAAGGVWWKLPAWKAELLGAQDEVVGQLITQLERPPSERGAAAAELPGTRVADPRPDAGASPVPGHAVRFTQDDVEAARAGRRVLYQYTDDTGRVRFVSSLREVPAAQREHAGRLEMGGGEAPSAGSRHLAPRPPAPPAKRAASLSLAPGVRVYVSPMFCPDCSKLTAWLDARGVVYQKINAFADVEALEPLLEKAQRTKLDLPVLEHGPHLIEGFQPERIASLLGLD